eukprot:CAMPEP_0197033496 /NCGR_PEP_ID=MMETSP1384-20130603/11891_1 /TAXON_ID=29189 /ORGANISM="Ammonia sp." /LENGTH=463 /DNA_ID=CAMNT_0042463309 /DNA_START=23 /DNA_END=1414 /DNA_ORIENTATION=-
MAQLMQNQGQQQQQQQALIDSKSLITTSKGWDLRIFRDEHLAQRFLCALCHNVCRDPHELSCSNAHLFCETCINDYSNNSNTTTCPIDHELNVTHQASRFVTRHIKELYVFCPRSKIVCSKLMRNARFNNNQLFCNFEGTLQNLVDHVNHQCIFNVIACPFHLIGCPTNQMYRYELQNHINSAQNKHISLALQKIQKLQTSLKQKEDSNEIYQEQLRALKMASKAKDEELDKLRYDNEKLEINNSNLVQECNRLKDELNQANQRIVSYSKAVNLLKENNSKLAEQVDDLSTAQQQFQQQQQMQQYGGSLNHNMSSHSIYSSEHHQMNNNNNNGNANNNEQTAELSNQFNALLSLQRSNVESHKQNSSMLNQMNSASGAASDVGSGLDLINNNDDKQPNSTDVVCAFLKDHPEIVSKLKNSNQIMYANIITDDKYAAQFLKKMLQSGNDDYRSEISNIVQRLSQ